jgi:hypothetical protein
MPANLLAGGAMITSQQAYEIRPRKDRRGVNLICDVLHSVACGTVNQMQSRTQSTTRSFTAVRLGSSTLNGRFKKPV